jgi:hypothetical protein
MDNGRWSDEYRHIMEKLNYLSAMMDLLLKKAVTSARKIDEIENILRSDQTDTTSADEQAPQVSDEKPPKD